MADTFGKKTYWICQETTKVAGHELNRQILVVTRGDQEIGDVWAACAFPDDQEGVQKNFDGSVSCYYRDGRTVDITEYEELLEYGDNRLLEKYLPVMELKQEPVKKED